MQRLTKRHDDQSYEASDLGAAVYRLGRLEDLYEAMLQQRDDDTERLNELKEKGSRSATRQQILAHRLMLQNMLDRFDIYAGG